MEITIYKCDFCKKTVDGEECLTNFDGWNTRYELCKSCYNEAMEIQKEFEEKYNKAFKKFEKDLEILKKEKGDENSGI